MVVSASKQEQLEIKEQIQDAQTVLNRILPGSVTKKALTGDICRACVFTGNHAEYVCFCGHNWFHHKGHSCSTCGLRSCFKSARHIEEATIQQLSTAGKCSCVSCAFARQYKSIYISQHSGSYSDPKHPANVYGLNKNLDLTRAAADFYLLLHTTLLRPGNSIIQARLTEHESSFAFQLATYLELASLGEFRYGMMEPDRPSKQEVPETWDEEAEPALVLEHLAENLRENSRNTSGRDSRMVAWGCWNALSGRFGLKLHDILSDGFRTLVPPVEGYSGFPTVGGPKWALCIETVGAYRKGKLSTTLFVDQALGLKHNGAVAYNKFWSKGLLEEVLYWARNDNLANISHIATPSIRDMCYEVLGVTEILNTLLKLLLKDNPTEARLKTKAERLIKKQEKENNKTAKLEVTSVT